MNLTTHRAGLSVPGKSSWRLLDRVVLVILITVIATAAAWAALVAPATRAPGAAAAPIEFDGPAYVDHRRGERGSSSGSTNWLSDTFYVEFRQGERSGSSIE